jgi:Rieske Fe-S protein
VIQVKYSAAKESDALDVRNTVGLDILGRRGVLCAGLATTFVALAPRARADDQEDDPARSERPKEGDQFVFLGGDREGEVIAPADIPVGGPLVFAYPQIPATKQPRDGSRLNQVVFVRFDPASYSDEERPHTVEGIAAYSAICTHAQCTVTLLTPKETIRCFCHNSEYDPRQSCKVVFGPAPRPLAILPIRITDGQLEVAGPFMSKVGGTPGAAG